MGQGTGPVRVETGTAFLDVLELTTPAYPTTPPSF